MMEMAISGSKTMRLNLTVDEWRALRVRAAIEGVSVTAYATSVLREHLRKRGAKKPAPES
jgi:plasmid stability protein